MTALPREGFTGHPEGGQAIRTVPTFCGKDCGGDACPLLLEVEGGRAGRVYNNPAAGPWLKGCRRGFDLPRLHYAPERLRRPLIRTGARGSREFREASWEEALGLAASRLSEARSRGGPASTLCLASAGATGALQGSSGLAKRFLNAAGGATFLSGSYSNGAARFVLPYLLGPDWARSGFDAATLRHSRMIVLWGANILDTRFGSELTGRLAEAKRRGAEIVSIDPRATGTVRNLSTRWLPIRPGTDAALMLAILHTLLSEGLADLGFARSRALGFEELEAAVLGGAGGTELDAAWAEPITGIPAAETRRLAWDWARNGPVCLMPGYSIQRSYAGEEPYRLSLALQLATGNFGRLGGSTGSLFNRLPRARCGTLPSLERPGFPSLPVLRWPEAILEGRAGGYPAELSSALVLGSNYLNQGPDIAKNARALESLEFSLCLELFLTPTAAYCDVVLPAASPLEKADIGIPFSGNHLLYKPAALPPEGQSRSDYEILRELSERMGFGRAFSEGLDEAAWIERLLDDSEVGDRAAFKESGIHFGLERERVGLAEFAADPLGHPLRTPSGRVELRSEALEREAGLPALPAWRVPPPDPAFPLSLISPKSGRRTHSQGGWREEEYEDGEPRVEIHPADASPRGILEGSSVRVRSRAGEIRIRARLSEGIRPGCVSIYEGVWASIPLRGGDASPNFLSDTAGNPGSLSVVMHALPVELEVSQGSATKV